MFQVQKTKFYRKKNKSILTLVFVIFILFSLVSCNNNESSQRDDSIRTVVDMKGEEVEIPNVIDNYAVAWTGDFDIAAMLDNCEHISAYPETSLKFPMVLETYPQLKECVPLPKVNVSCESILETNAQVVFLRESDYPELTEELHKANVPVIDLNFENYEELVQAVHIFADVLNTDEAKAKADKYEEYVNSTIENTRKIVGEQKTDISVLNFRDAVDYTAYSPDRLVGSWASLCNIKYSLENVDSTDNITLTSEQIYEFDPDYIFFTFPGNQELMLSDDKYKNLTAVKKGHVYDAPAVLNSFAVNGSEAILQIKWAIALMFPEKVDYILEDDIKAFYKEFFDLDLSDNVVKELLWNNIDQEE